jgi:predicted RNA-binding Zn ribbon-like protein
VRVDPDRPEGQTGEARADGGSSFIWTGGRLALDLCNTRLGEREYLASPADLARWVVEAGLLPAPVPVSVQELWAARALRDGLRVGLLAGEKDRVGAVAHAWLDSAPGRLCVEGATLQTRFTPGAETAFCALVSAVLDALELARDWPGRVRECASEACPVVFLDTSRNGSRRWCSMERCGARAKATTYYQRHRGP